MLRPRVPSCAEALEATVVQLPLIADHLFKLPASKLSSKIEAPSATIGKMRIISTHTRVHHLVLIANSFRNYNLLEDARLLKKSLQTRISYILFNARAYETQSSFTIEPLGYD